MPCPRAGRRATAIAVLLTLLLAACGSGEDSSSPSRVEIIVPNFPQMITGVEETLDVDFTERTGIEVSLIKVGDTSYTGVDQRVQNDLVAGNTLDLAITGLNSLRTYADSQVAAALDETISQDEDFDLGDFYPTLLDLGRFGGTVYGIPYGVSTYTLYYNADVFRAAGLDPDTPPATFSEMRQAAEAIVSSGAAANGVIVRSDHVGGYGFQNFLESGGGSFMNAAETQVKVNSPEAVSVVQYWAGLNQDGTGRAMANEQAGDVFTRGDAGMILQSSSYSATLSEQVTFDVRSAPFPIPDGGTRRAAAGGAAIVSFATDPGRLADQWTVIKELISPRGVTNLVTASGYAPVNTKAADDPEYLGGYLEDNPLSQAGWDQMTDLAPWYQFPGSRNAEIKQSMADQINEAIDGGKPAQAALDDAAAEIENLLE